MRFFRNAVDSDDVGLPSAVTQAKLSRYVVDFITSMRATVVSLGMYPPHSKTIANAIEKVSKNLSNVLEMQPTITFSEVNGLLLIEGEQLDERDRKKAPVIDFLTSLIERKIQSLTFDIKATPEELVAFLVIMSKKPKELKVLGPLDEQMIAQNVKNIQLNERIYVASTQEEQEAMDRRERLLAKFLSDEVGTTDINDDEISDLLVDKDQLDTMLKKMVVDEEEGDSDGFGDRKEYVAMKAEKLNKIMVRSYYMLKAIPDEEQRTVFKDSLATTVAEQDHDVIGRVLLNEQRNPTELSKLDLTQMLFDKMDAEKSIGVTNYTIEEVKEVKTKLHNFPPEERAARVNAIKKMVKLIINDSTSRDFFGQIIELMKMSGLVKPELAKQLQARAAEAQEGAQASEAGSLINEDGSVNQEILNKSIRLFDKIPSESISGVLSSLSEVIGEVVFHSDVNVLIEKIISRMSKEYDFSPIYQSCTDFLEKLCKELIFNEDYTQAINIINAFQSHADPEAERHNEQKKRALKAIEVIASEDVNRMLLTVYQHGEEEAKHNVAQLIVRMGQRMQLALLDLLKTSEDRGLRRNIINLMQKMGKEILPLIQTELNTSSNQWYVHRNMVMLLAEVGSSEHVEWLNQLLSHEEARVRRETVKALVKLDPEHSVEYVRNMMVDKDMQVKRFAMGLLGTLKDVQSIPEIKKYIEKQTIAKIELEEEVQLDAVNALGKMGNESVVPCLIEALKKEGMFSKLRTKTPLIRSRIIFALANYQTPEVAKAIKAAAKDKSDDVREAAKSVMTRMQF